ncbi:MAG: imidazolonepropionase-like amidohydrolase [Myxococcota bacterium]
MIPWLMATAVAAPLVLKAAEVRPVSGPPIANGVVVVEDGRIVAVGRADAVTVPAGARVFEGAVLTPGFIDTLTTAGLTGPLNHPPDQDHAERNRPVSPGLRALDGYNGTDAMLGWIRGFGVTTVHSGPSPGTPVGGRTLVAKTTSGPVDEVAMVPDAMLLLSLGDGPKWRFGDDGTASRMGSAATVRQALATAADYAARQRLPPADRPPVDLGLAALAEVLDGGKPVVVHAHRADDLLTALRIGDEFGLDLILAGAAEGWLVADRLAAAGVPVLVGPVMARSWRDGEQRNSAFDNAAILADAGVPVAFLSGHEGYVPKVRVVLWEAAIAGANGLGAERTLEALTLGAARILRIDDSVGSLEVGKQADLVLFDGDPFEYTTHACTVVIGGDVVSETCH